MSVEIIYTCDLCGQKGHCTEAPSKECIKALKAVIDKLESEVRGLERLKDKPRDPVREYFGDKPNWNLGMSKP